MSNKIIDKIFDIRQLDKDITREKSDQSAKLDSLNKDLNRVKNASFVDECVMAVGDFYNEAKRTVKEICDLQDSINLSYEYKLITYLDDAFESYKDEDFINVFERESKIFSTAIKSILSARTAQQLTSKSVIELFNKAASSYAIIENINSRAKNLATNYLNSRIKIESKKIEEEISNYKKSAEADLSDKICKLKSLVNELEEQVAEEEKKQQAAIISHDDKMTEDFSSEYELCIGKITPSDQSYNVFSKNINYEKSYNLSTLATIPGYSSTASSNIKLDTSDCDEAVANEFAENLIMKFLTSYPAQFKKVVALHNQTGSILLNVMTQAYSCGMQSDFAWEKGREPVAYNEGNIEEVLKYLDKRINDVCSRLGVSGYYDIYSYNENHPDTAEPIILVVIKDFPSGFLRSDSLDLLQRVYEQGNKAGIITFVMWDQKKVKQNYGEEVRALDIIKNLPAGYDLVGKGSEITADNDAIFTPLVRKPGFKIQKFFENANEELKRQNKPIDLLDIQSKEEFKSSPRRKDFSEILDIPIGKSSGKVVSLKLSSSDKAHVVVNGGTGSGKTAFLHTLILSAAYNYSPDELEVNLFDFKDGVGFKMYKEKRLPHVNFIALENKIEDALEVLEYINSMMTERNRLISSFDGVNSLKGYNKLAAEKKDPSKPVIRRSLIIIDEYQLLLMNDKCVSILENIARQGRSAGISLVLVSQDVPNESGFTKIKQLLDHRFAFRGSSDNVDRLISGAGRRAAELELQKGICFYEANDSIIKSLRVAFSGDDSDLAENIDRMSRKYGDCTRPLQIVGAPKPLIIRDYSDVPEIPADVRARDYENGICNYILGKYCLTQKPVKYISDESNTLLTIVGNYVKSKQIITSLICNQLITLSRAGKKDGEIVLIDLCDQRRLLQVDSPLKQLAVKCQELEDEGDESLKSVKFSYADGFKETVENLYNIYTKRNQDQSVSIDPIEVIILGTSFSDILNRDRIEPSPRYSRNEEVDHTLDYLKELIQKGRSVDIYLTIQTDDLDSAFAKNVLLRGGTNLLKDLVVLSGDDTDSSLRIRNVISAISPLIGTKVAAEYTKSLDKNPLDPSLCFIVDDGNISKYSYFRYEGEWLDSFLKHLR